MYLECCKSKDFIIAMLVFVYLWYTDMETVKSNHVSRFGIDLKCSIFVFRVNTIEIYLVGIA